MGKVSKGSSCKGTTPFLSSKHDWTWSRMHGHYVCKNHGCNDYWKGPKPKGDGDFDDTIKGKMSGSSQTIKGGVWGNKADKEMAASRHRQNSDSGSPDASDEEKKDGCPFTLIVLLGGSLTALGLLADAVRVIVA